MSHSSDPAAVDLPQHLLDQIAGRAPIPDLADVQARQAPADVPLADRLTQGMAMIQDLIDQRDEAKAFGDLADVGRLDRDIQRMGAHFDKLLLQFEQQMDDGDRDMPVCPKADRQVMGQLDVWTDGGWRDGNGSVGVVVTSGPVLVDVLARPLGLIDGGSNGAEFAALLHGLRLCMSYQPRLVICHLDSQLVIQHVTGQQLPRNQIFKALTATYQLRVAQIAAVDGVRVVYVDRAANLLADKLATLALDMADSSDGRRWAAAYRLANLDGLYSLDAWQAIKDRG